MKDLEQQLYDWVEAAYRIYNFEHQLFMVGITCETENIYINQMTDCIGEHIIRLLIAVTFPAKDSENTQYADVLYDQFFDNLHGYNELGWINETFEEAEEKYPNFKLTEANCPSDFINLIISLLRDDFIQALHDSSGIDDDWDF